MLLAWQKGLFDTYIPYLLHQDQINAEVVDMFNETFQRNASNNHILVLLTNIQYRYLFQHFNLQGIYILDSEGLKFKQCSYGWWDHSLALGEFLFLMWGIKVCFSVRKARTHYDEAKLITWSIYNIATVNIIMAAIQ